MTDERTNEQISAAIAERLLRWVWVEAVSCWVDRDGLVVATRSEFKPASDHNTALGLVVPEMRKRGWQFSLVDVGDEVRAVFFSKNLHRTVLASAPFGEEPCAICLAALAALDQEGKG